MYPEAMKRQLSAYQTLIHSQEEELKWLRSERDQYHDAIATLDSEREMNKILTEALEAKE